MKITIGNTEYKAGGLLGGILILLLVPTLVLALAALIATSPLILLAALLGSIFGEKMPKNKVDFHTLSEQFPNFNKRYNK